MNDIFEVIDPAFAIYVLGNAPLKRLAGGFDRADGPVWFSDPHYGIMTDHEGFRAKAELPCQIYRIDPGGTVEAMVTDMMCPNGLAFSPDESLLYVADTGRMFTDDPQHIRVYDMMGGQPVNGRHFHTIQPGCADGIRVDSDGNLWSSAADGVHCIAPDGHLMGKIVVPRWCRTCASGGARSTGCSSRRRPGFTPSP